MLGRFNIRDSGLGMHLITYGPADLAEYRLGVPLAGFALMDGDKMVFSADKLADFLNAAIASSHGDHAPMSKLCQPKADAA